MTHQVLCQWSSNCILALYNLSLFWYRSLVLSSWASLISSTDSASIAWITVDHVYGLVARTFQTWKTEVKHWRGSLGVEATKHSWSLGVSPSWMLICFHFAGTLLATSFIRSDSSGLLSKPKYLLPKAATKRQQAKLWLLQLNVLLRRHYLIFNMFCHSCKNYDFQTVQHWDGMMTISPETSQVKKPYENWRRMMPGHDFFCCFPTATWKMCTVENCVSEDVLTPWNKPQS